MIKFEGQASLNLLNAKAKIFQNGITLTVFPSVSVPSLSLPNKCFSGLCVKSLSAPIATLGPTWEFQLSLKSCNLASWTTKWL